MDLKIFGIEDAAKFKPDKPTYAIRISSPDYRFDRDLKPFSLVDSSLYIHTAEYYFEDIAPSINPRHLKVFDEGLAKKVLKEFEDNRKGCESLLVHCIRGKNRSPAVAIALNEIFNLGHDTDALKAKYNQSTWHVYDVMKKTAAKIL